MGAGGAKECDRQIPDLQSPASPYLAQYSDREDADLNGFCVSRFKGVQIHLPALEHAHFFASHLAEVPERINTGPAPDQVTQLEHGAIG
jgi:hypothetical protein